MRRAEYDAVRQRRDGWASAGNTVDPQKGYRAGFDRIESLNGVVAGLVPATPNVKALSQIIEVAGTSPATTGERGPVLQPDRNPL